MDTPRFGLPLLFVGQAQKEVTHNEAIEGIDRLLHLTVQSRQQATPPLTAVAGDSWIVPDGAGGAWAGRTDLIASHDGFGWVYTAPVNGMVALVADEGGFIGYDDGWSALWPVAGLIIAGRQVLAAPPATIAPPAGGSVIDVESRNVISALIAALQDQGVLS